MRISVFEGMSVFMKTLSKSDAAPWVEKKFNFKSVAWHR